MTWRRLQSRTISLLREKQKSNKKTKKQSHSKSPLAFFSLVFRSFDCGNLSIRVRATRGSDQQAITKFTLTEPFLKASLNSFFVMDCNLFEKQNYFYQQKISLTPLSWKSSW